MRPILILLLVVVIAVVSMVTATAMQPAEPTPSAPASAAPTAICAPAPVSRLIARERARVSVEDPRPLNMRNGPGTAFDVITQIPAGGMIYVLEGPQCSQNYAWYRVVYNGDEGWIAEGDDSGYYVEIYPPGW